jgi:hypothetical protein
VRNNPTNRIDPSGLDDFSRGPQFNFHLPNELATMSTSANTVGAQGGDPTGRVGQV